MPIEFARTLLRMPVGWVIRVGLMGLVHGAAVFFLPRIEAIVVPGAVTLGLVIQLMVFGSQGLVRLLGTGHFPWLVTLEAG